MPLSPLVGHAAARAALGRSLAGGRLPQSILLHGPTGIGKERLGIWLAQLLMCARPVQGSEPCGECQPCRMVLRLQHPDVHWFFPLPRPDGATPAKLREKLEELRGAELEARRGDPLHVPAYDKPPAHFLAAVQTLQQLAANRPAMGSRKVFVVGDAELMVPQESSPEAANAFLKLLEEPPADTTLILTTHRTGALLPTILSRVLPVRLLPLADEEVAAFLRSSEAVAEPRIERAAALAQGSIGRALRTLPSADGVGVLEKQRQSAKAWLEATLSASPALRLAAAHAVAPSGGRGDFLGVLDALAGWLRDLMAVACGVPGQVRNRGDLPFLERSARAAALHPLAVGAALQRLDPARKLAEGNVNPQLVLADLLRGIQRDLRVPA